MVDSEHYVDTVGYKRPLFILSILILCIISLWSIIFHQAIMSAAEIWWLSEIYTHGFFIIPISIYLIWSKRSQLSHQPVRPSCLPIPIIIFSSLIYIIGYAGDIKLFQHVGAFSILPLTIWLVLGNDLSKIILFPLAFILFSIPIGEELIPILQQITADISVLILKSFGVPIFRNGLYIDIPNGRFLVAEACSGVRFFVGATVFAAIYSYISYRARFKQYLYFWLALFVPIIANSIRVATIILIGYISDMKYATGVDHIIYGWVFFAIVIILLVLIGNIWSDRSVEVIKSPETYEQQTQVLTTRAILPIIIAISIYLSIFVLQESIVISQQHIEQNINSNNNINVFKDQDWSPKYFGASEVVIKDYKDSNNNIINYYSAYYQYQTNNVELISTNNRIYNPKKWTLKKSNSIRIKRNDDLIDAQIYSIVGANGKYRYIIYWYEIGELYTFRKLPVKLYQAFEILAGKSARGRVVIYSVRFDNEYVRNTKYDFIEFVNNNENNQ